MMASWQGWLAVAILLGRAVVGGPETQPAKPSKLVAAKLVHVEPMPANLDQWILEYLRAWGKFKLTGDAEGVDLVIRANAREKPTEYEIREGVPQPRGEGRRLPLPKRERRETPVLSVRVVDWVTNQTLWHVDLLDRKRGKDEAERPPGAHALIFARGMTSDQIAQKLVAKLREYVGELEKGSAEVTPGKTNEGQRKSDPEKRSNAPNNLQERE